MTRTFSYDVVDYPSHVYPQMHPSRLAAIARLHGVAAAAPDACRLLEVGCGDGLQLLALALAYPRSRFVGVDLSANAIARGEALRAQLGLANLHLVAADLAEWDAAPASFDYVIAHGFWSWVPDAVRTRLLQLCQGALDAAGIACISYNALPGCHLRRMLWEILKFHADGVQDPAQRIARARECLDLLVAGMPGDSRYGAAMAGEIAELRDRLEPSVLFHDDLAAINEPFSLDAFMRRAGAHGLAFVAEASYHEMSSRNAAEGVRPLLEQLGRDDLVTKEQYLDFFTGRRFRQTLLCHARAQALPVADPGAVAGLELASDLQPDPPVPDAQGRMRFNRPASGGVGTDNPLMQALLLHAGAQYPAALPVTELVDAARARSGSPHPRAQDLEAACRFLLGAFEVGIVDLHCAAPRLARVAGEHPCANPLARAQARAGAVQVASLRPATVGLDDAYTRLLLPALDGTRDRAALLAYLRERAAQDAPGAGDGGAALDADALEATLAGFARLGLLWQEDDGGPPAAQRTV